MYLLSGMLSADNVGYVVMTNDASNSVATRRTGKKFLPANEATQQETTGTGTN